MTAAAFPTAAPPAPKIRRYSVAEYVQREIETDEKHYFINGTLIPMAGGTPPHVRIGGNMFYFLSNKLEDQDGYEVFPSDIKIHIPAFNFYNYADACVVSEKPVFTDDPAEALTNPVLIVEVLSKTTRGYDQKRKFDEYKTIPSFREYVLIEQDKPLVKSWLKDADGVWHPSRVAAGLENEVRFQSVGVSLPLSKIYRNVSFESVK